jgi:hypothetical protein
VVEAPEPGTPGTVRYRGPRAVRQAEFVALDAGPRTPTGLLGRVVAARVEDGDTLIDVVPASLPEVVPEGRLELSGGPVAAGRRARAGARGFRAALGCGPGVRGEVGGSLGLTLDPAFELRWSGGRVRSARAAVALRGDAALTASIAAGGSCSLPATPVATWDAPPLRTFVGPVPVVVVPRTTLYVSGQAEAKAALEVGLNGSLSATAALRYDGATVDATGTFEPAFTATEPAPRGAASLGARVTPSVAFLLYGEAGPRFDLSTGLQLDAAPGTDPWWTLTAPVELSAGLAIPHSDTLSVAQQTVFSRSFPLAEAAPGDQSGGAGVERARIDWDTGSTDVDLHVWDEDGNHASYEAPGAVDGGLLSPDDRDGFGPETFAEEDGRGRTLTFGLCYFDDRGAGATTVDVQLTDPDGAVHTITRTLARKGEGVVLGASPGGPGYVPADGWCSPAP